MRFEFSLGVYVRDLVVMLLCVFEGSLITMKRFKMLSRGFDGAQTMEMDSMISRFGTQTDQLARYCLC